MLKTPEEVIAMLGCPSKRGPGAAALLLCAMALAAHSVCGAEPVGFESDRWTKPNARVFDYLGRTALMGTAYLGDVEFENGLIEVDVAVTGRTSYPGIRFRMQSDRDYEECYIRPHRAGRYPDAVQYAPVFNGISCWQLYNGDGYTSAAEISPDEWVHMKIEILGDQARVFLGDTARPVLEISHLEHGLARGGIGISGPMDGSACFSNFAYRLTDDLEFTPPVPPETAPGVMLSWEVSRSFRISDLDLETYPLRQDLGNLEWRPAVAEPSGLVNVARLTGRSSMEPECVLARASIVSGGNETKKIEFGYSDWVGIFLNGDMLFAGNSSYRGRDPSFLGIVGLNDAVYLPLRKGENELLLVVAESFGGWGFMCRDAGIVFEGAGVSEAWETGKVFKVPESIAYDPAAGVVYVSNYDAYDPSRGKGRQSVSKVSLAGEVLELDWASGLENPTGMAVWGDRLFVVERSGLVEIDTGTGEISARYPAAGQGFLNDAAVDEAGNVYVSDSRGDAIYRLEGEELRVWLEGGPISQPNGLCVADGSLIVGNNGDRSLKAVDLATGDISTVARMGPGIIDGIASDRHGNYIVSHWEGRIYRISPKGDREKILDVTGPAYNCADLAFVPDTGLLVIPGFTGDTVRAYRVVD
jgi:sugar lactone lactonase YvrE